MPTESKLTQRAMDYKERRRLIGNSVWLLVLLARYTPSDWDGRQPVWISGGNAIGDRELADLLGGVSVRTLATWRRRLRKAGVLRWLIAPEGGRVFILQNCFPESAEVGQPAKKDEEKSEQAAPETRTWIQ